MAELNKNELKIIRDLQKEITESTSERSNAAQKEAKIYNQLLGSMREAAKVGKQSAGQIMDMARIIKKVADTEDNLEDIQKRRSKLQKDIAFNVQKEKEGQIKSAKNANAGFKVEDKILKAKAQRVKGQERINNLQEKAKDAWKTQVLQAGLLVGALALIKKLAFAFAERIDKLGSSFGVAAAQSGKLQTNLLESSNEMVKLGGGLDQAISMTNILSSDFGLSAAESARMASNIFDSSVAMGLSADEGANLFGILMSMGNLTQSQAENLAESTYQLARAEGVAPQAVMKDIAGSADIFAKYMKDGGQNVLDAAVQAKKLGLSLSDVDTIASGLLDFQSSLNAEIEASIMLGRDVNLQKARELALNDDLTGMMEEVVKQAGGEAEFNKLNRLERDAIAKAIGLTASQMAKVVGEHGKLETQRSFADIAGPEAISNLTNIINQVKSFGAVLLDKVGPILEETFGTFLAWMKSADGLKSMTSFITSFIDKITNLPGIIRGIVMMMVGWKAISLGVAAANMAIAVGVSGAKTGFIGLGIGVAAALGAWAAIAALPSFANLPPGMAATPNMGGSATAHSTGTFGSETIMHTDKLEKKLDSLVNIMEAAWGFGGTAPKQMGKEFAGKMENIRSGIG